MPGDTETGTGSGTGGTGGTARTGLRSGTGIEAEAKIKLWDRLSTLIETSFT